MATKLATGLSPCPRLSQDWARGRSSIPGIGASGRVGIDARIPLAFHGFSCAFEGFARPTGKHAVSRKWKSVSGDAGKRFRRKAKFQEFGQVGEFEENPSADVETVEPVGSDDRDDRCLPDSLEGAVLQSSKSTSVFINGGGHRAIVELSIPDFEILADEGSQQKLWDSARIFIESLQTESKLNNVLAIFPDAGAAALLRHQWSDAPFRIASLYDRKPVSDEDDLVILVSPDHQSLSNVEKIASSLYNVESLPRPLVMWNPKLISGDVGIGLNVRRLRENFLSTFTVVYSLRPMSSGAVYRCYPEPWKLFLDDPDVPGRYLLYKEKYSRPDADDIDGMFFAQSSSNETIEEPSGINQVFSVFSSFSRFMKSLSQ